MRFAMGKKKVSKGPPDSSQPGQAVFPIMRVAMPACRKAAPKLVNISLTRVRLTSEASGRVVKGFMEYDLDSMPRTLDGRDPLFSLFIVFTPVEAGAHALSVVSEGRSIRHERIEVPAPDPSVPPQKSDAASPKQTGPAAWAPLRFVVPATHFSTTALLDRNRTRLFITGPSGSRIEGEVESNSKIGQCSVYIVFVPKEPGHTRILLLCDDKPVMEQTMEIPLPGELRGPPGWRESVEATRAAREAWSAKADKVEATAKRLGYEDVSDAAKQGDFKAVVELVNAGASIHWGARGAVGAAVSAGHLNIVKYLVDSGADISRVSHVEDSVGQTLALGAAAAGHVGVLRYLVEQGASLTNSAGALLTYEAAERVSLPSRGVVSPLSSHPTPLPFTNPGASRSVAILSGREGVRPEPNNQERIDASVHLCDGGTLGYFTVALLQGS